ncbi:helix-turn-helix domain-containing protein [Caldilinea sp.]|uniref:helix-turn-helix domain-containing protein n=1 Tax=Caldilinea sp. TaxID=2293560 RepID=UPI001B19C560|nr:helix-turn-helix domain-containing protein [Caldilinea sp.]MBO9393283.1 helix-turn-helix domain-containing protein [Caldilinea sp.]
MPGVIRIGLLADSADPFWVEVRETIWQFVRQQRTSGLDMCLAGAEAVELIDIEFIPDVHDYAVKVEEILALDLGALIAVPFAMPLLYPLLDNGLAVIALHERPFEHPRFVKPRTLYASGKLACEFLAERIGGQGRVLVVGGRETREGRSSRLQAAYDVFARFPDVQLIHLPAPWDRRGALEAVHEFLSGVDAAALNPIRGIFGLSDTLALVGREVCQEQNLLAADAVVVGINGDPLAIAAVARGEMAATVATSATHLATEALRLACLAAMGAAFPTEFDYCPQLVTSHNVTEIALRKLVAIADVPSRLVGVNRQMEERRLTQLQTGLEINHRIGSILDSGTLLREISALIRTNYGYDRVDVYLWDESTQSLIHQGLEEENALHNAYSLAEAGALGRALLSRRPVYIPDVQRVASSQDKALCGDTRTRVIAPIRFGGCILGVLDVHSAQLRRHVQADLDALQALADALGIALRNTQLYAEALHARAEAERANQLKTRLLANISHDLRAPLNIILGYSQAALAEPNPYNLPLPEELRTDLRHIYQSGLHLVRLVDDLLILSQAEIGALEIVPEWFDVGAFLRELFEGMAGSCEQCNVEWRLELPQTLPALYADPVRLRQVLLNLLDNAQKHTSSGHITLRATAEETTLHIWVEDTGNGIDPFQRERLNALLAFEESELDHRRFSVGLGLRVAHHILLLHGGALTLHSKPGHGTLCHIQLPLTPPAATSPALEPPISEMAGPETQERLLQRIQQHCSGLSRRIAQYMVDHYANPISREEIAQAMQVSEDYISRVFRKETGMTPWQFLNRYRIIQAQKLLLSTDYSVTEIGTMVGFNDPAYFTRVFHRETGKSPQQYRKSAK